MDQNGGASWTYEYLGSRDGLAAIAFPSAGVAYAVGGSFHVYRWTGVYSSTPVNLSSSPAKSTLTYKRKKGVAKYVLSAKLTSSGLAVSSTLVCLQTSARGKTWKDAFKFTTDANGSASKAFSAKKKSTLYYRWSAPASSVHTAATSFAQKVIVK